MVRRSTCLPRGGLRPDGCWRPIPAVLRASSMFFRRTWNVDATVSALEQTGDKCRAWWTVRLARPELGGRGGARGAAVGRHRARGFQEAACAAAPQSGVRVLRPLIVTGTMFRYNRREISAMRSFSCFPIFSVVLFAVGGWLVARLAIGFSRPRGRGGRGARRAGRCRRSFSSCCDGPGRRWARRATVGRLDLAPTTTFTAGAPISMPRLELFCRSAAGRGARDAGLDEIVIVGHSLGAIAGARRDRPRTLRAMRISAGRGAAVCVLTIGATIPKFALHPHAQAIRGRIAQVAAETSIAWTEYQSRGRHHQLFTSSIRYR